MRKRYFISFIIVSFLLSGCASSERMLRLGADHTSYSKPENERIKGYTKDSRKAHRYFRKNTGEDIARDTSIDDTLVNLWPFYLANSQYTSILWPMIDWDDYGIAFRPFYNQEGMEYSILFPLSAWNPHNKDGWVLNAYWNPQNIGMIPLFNTPRKTGFHYYGPVWFFNDIYRGSQRNRDWNFYTDAPDKKWGVFPFLWMNCGPCRDYNLLFPIAGWDSNFDLQHQLNYIGPFWNRNKECGVFPIFRHNYGDKGMLNSFLIPFYIWRKDMFLSIPYCTHDQDYGGKREMRYDLLNCDQTLQKQKSSWRSVMLAFWGKEQLKRQATGKPAEYRYYGFFPLFRYADMGAWNSLGFGPFNWLAGWNSGPNVKMTHILGPLGFLRKEKENAKENSEWRFSCFASLLLFYCGNRDFSLWQDPKGTEYGYLRTYDSLVFRLRNMTKGGKREQSARRNSIQRDLRIYQIPDSMPKTQKEANCLADKIEKTYHTVKRHEYYHAFIPFWYYKTTDDKSETQLILPFLLAKWKRKENTHFRFTDCIVGTPLVFRKKHSMDKFRGNPREYGDIEKITEYGSWGNVEYEQFKIFGFEQEKFRGLYWKGNVSKTEKKRKGTYWIDCGEGKIPWDEAAKRERDYFLKNTETHTILRRTFIGKLFYLSLTSDAGERRVYAGGGLLAKRETVGDSDDFHVLGFLYRYQKKKAAERTFIFPFILKQKDGSKEKFSFGWRLFSCEYENGKCTGGHIFFIPFLKTQKLP